MEEEIRQMKRKLENFDRYASLNNVSQASGEHYIGLIVIWLKVIWPMGICFYSNLILSHLASSHFTPRHLTDSCLANCQFNWGSFTVSFSLGMENINPSLGSI